MAEGIRSFWEWIGEQPETPPWLVLGKGPSFRRYVPERDAATYRVFGLNHVCTVTPVFLTHVCDYDVVPACGQALLSNSRFLVMPYWPHTNNRPGKLSLHACCDKHRILHTLRQEGRLLVYNSSLAAKKSERGPGPLVYVRYFSAVAAIRLLAMAGVKNVTTVGIDGGSSYAPVFNKSTLLANGRDSFDIQFEAIAETCQKFKMTVTRRGGANP